MSPYPESTLLPLSALQHWLFCPRQCGLIHVEQVWEENRLTAEGRAFHEQAHSGVVENRPGVTIARSVPLRSLRLGLSGIADVVEMFHIEGLKQRQPYPVEYKHGKPHPGSQADAVQLCAQAMCLEEMLGVEIPEGALYYGKRRRRTPICLTDELRKITVSAAQALHELIQHGVLPLPIYGSACESCSLVKLCLPQWLQNGGNASKYLNDIIHSS